MHFGKLHTGALQCRVTEVAFTQLTVAMGTEQFCTVIDVPHCPVRDFSVQQPDSDVDSFMRTLFIESQRAGPRRRSQRRIKGTGTCGCETQATQGKMTLALMDVMYDAAKMAEATGHNISSTTLTTDEISNQQQHARDVCDRIDNHDCINEFMTGLAMIPSILDIVEMLQTIRALRLSTAALSQSAYCTPQELRPVQNVLGRDPFRVATCHEDVQLLAAIATVSLIGCAEADRYFHMFGNAWSDKARACWQARRANQQFRCPRCTTQVLRRKSRAIGDHGTETDADSVIVDDDATARVA